MPALLPWFAARPTATLTDAISTCGAGPAGPSGPTAGGSARPWGLVLPEERGKEVEGDWEPEVREVALSNW